MPRNQKTSVFPAFWKKLAAAFKIVLTTIKNVFLILGIIPISIASLFMFIGYKS